MLVDLGGTLVPAADARVSPFDGGFLYGDGIFDTLRTYRGFAFQLDEHLDRLQREAELLQLQVDLDEARWSARLTALLEANDLRGRDAAVRIQVSRGGDPDTDQIHADPASLRPTEFMFARAVGPEVQRRQEDGVRILSMQPAFARGNFPQMKTLNYLPSVMASRFAQAQGYDEAILLNRQSKILEGASSNVFVVKDNTVRTPSVRLGLLPGITRQKVMEIAAGLGLRVEETASELRDLMLADEVFLTGSVKEVVPVIGVDKSDVANALPGLWTQQIQQAYHDEVERARDAAS